MLKPETAIINEIAQQLDCGNECFFNQKTGELICIPNANLMATGDEEYYKEVFKEDLKKIESQKNNLIKFEVLESFESYKIMEEFRNQIDDNYFKEELTETLSRRKPFQNFKYLIDHSQYREEWFKFKHKEIVRLVYETINTHSARL